MGLSRFMASGHVLALSAALLLVLGGVGLAGSIDGKWEAEVTGNRGTRTFMFDLKQNEGELTGTLDLGRRQLPIQEGTIDGDTVAFVVMLKTQDREIKMEFSGALSEDALDLVLQTRGRTRDVTAKRVQ